MCRPTHFGVTYTINPWMEPKGGRAHRPCSRRVPRQWAAAPPRVPRPGAEIELIPAVGPARPGVHRQCRGGARRQGAARAVPPSRTPPEEPHAGRRPARSRPAAYPCVREAARGPVLEGAGDCVFDATRNLSGWATARAPMRRRGSTWTSDIFGVEVVALELADPRFYHMDTALCPFDRRRGDLRPGCVHARGPRRHRGTRAGGPAHRDLRSSDARRLAANTVCIGKDFRALGLQRTACALVLGGARLPA